MKYDNDKECIIKNKDIMERKQNNNVPKIGKEYHFFDDGKTSLSRHYVCRCEREITSEEAKAITFDLDDGETTLYDIWKDESSKCDFLFAKDTDFFVEVSCPSYDENNLWAVRTKDGGWFTLDVQSYWQGGRVDVTGKIFDDVVRFWTEEGETEMVNNYLKETYD